MSPKLEELRDELSALDRQLLDIVRRRTALSLEIGREKQALGRGTRDFGREKVVLERARDAGSALGLPDGLAESLTLHLIQASLSVQEQDRISETGVGAGRRALVIGGAGKMGRWFVGFLTTQGYEVTVADPGGTVPGVHCVDDWRDLELDHDFVIVAAQLNATNTILHEMVERRPTGVVFDVGSLKTPLRTGLLALRDAGVRVTSVHPMFGPNTNLLSGRHVLFIDLGITEATEAARSLFLGTMAEQADMDLETHDELIAFVLGLSHAVNLAFNTALATSGAALPLLARISSTTFDSQLQVSTRVASENPHLYYEIQAHNHYGATSLNALARAIDAIREAVHNRDETAFVEMMLAGRAYVDARDGA